MADYLFLIPLFPLCGVIVNGLLGRRFPEKLIGVVGSAAIFGAFVVTVAAFLELVGQDPEHRRLVNSVYPWISAGPLSIPIAFLLDPLSAVMALIVTGVSFVIHVYAIGYMHGETGFRRFFVYLNLFVFAMLLLVLGDNLVVMFIGWEGVGLCSYLLIGYYYEKKSASDAGKKAFIVNRIGDFGFLLGIFLLFWTYGTVEFEGLGRAVGGTEYGGVLVTVTALCLFLGATGKSAQIPLYVWLPDAMEGPTPVSALIHAATMVTAGVYMVARMNFLFVLAPTAMMVVAATGAATAIYAASIGFFQRDIKRILAYSTISQLGYMFLAVGVGAFTAGIFHLMTHAFFKACLFLGAGSVMHAMHGELDVFKMGGLRRKMPHTHATFLIATLAIAGIPGLSGFFSKDEILWMAFSAPRGHAVLYFIGLITAGMTAFYMFRAVILTFWGEPRDHHLHDHAHESPPVMTVVLWTLAVLAIVGGWIGLPKALTGVDINFFEHWLEPVFAQGEEVIAAHAHHAGEHSHALEYLLMAVSVGAGLLGIFIAWSVYQGGLAKAEGFRAKAPAVHRAMVGKYFVDEGIFAAIIRPIHRISESFLWRFFDVIIIDGSVNGVAKTALWSAGILRRLQTGYVFSYALGIVIGCVAILGALVLYLAHATGF
jgi:NADH-quinone oxidoreductase subunit L